MKKNLVIILAILNILGACNGGGESTEYEKMLAIQRKLKNYEKDKQKAEKKAKKIREERNKKGDTIALKDKELRSFLPKEIDGFKPNGEFVGSYHQLSGLGYSNAEQNYVKDNQHLRITLVDYNTGVSPHAEMVAFWDKGLIINNRSERAGKVMLKGDLKAWEVYFKRKKRAELTVAVSDRIILTIIADKQKDTEFVKKIAESMDLATLAGK